MKPNRVPIVAAIALVCVVGALLLLRSLLPPTPAFIARAHAPVTDANWADGAWYWLEGAGTPGARLMRDAGPSVAVVAAESEISGFAVGQGKVVWAAGNARQWHISSSAPDGSGRVAVWSGDGKPRGLYVADRHVVWLAPSAPIVPNSGPFPPLDDTFRVMSAPFEGTPPAPVGEVMEAQGDRVLGVHGGQFYIAASRPGLMSITTVYRMPVAGGAPRRVAGERGEQHALLAADGTLYWTGTSRESTQRQRETGVRRLGANDSIEWLEDWLPGGGRLYESAGRVYYVDGGQITNSVWPIIGPNRLPTSLALPTGYTVLAVGNGEVLAERLAVTGKDASIYRIPLP